MRHQARSQQLKRRRRLVAVTTVALAVAVSTVGLRAFAETDDDAPATGSDMAGMPMGGPAPGPAPAKATSSATARADGAWSSPATWGGAVPAAGAAVVVPAGRTVTLDVVPPALRTVVVQGTLTAAQGRTVGLTADAVAVRGGTLRIGTESAPFTGKATITLTGTTAADNPVTPGQGNKVLALDNGTIDLHGAPVAAGWTQLGADAAAGATTLTLAKAAGWAKGDQVVVSTSDMKQDDAEVATIASVSGATLTLAAPLKHKHLGTVKTVGDVKVDVRAEVGLLSHNIVVQGDADSARLRLGGHAMFMASSKASVKIEDAEFRAMGQYDRLGRYPVHFHLMGTRCSGCYVRRTAVHDTVQRGIVLHDTTGVTLQDDVVYNTVGHNIVLETEKTNGNTVKGNLALVNRQPVPAFTEPTLKTQNDRLPSNFWFKSPQNTVTGNHAAGSFDDGFTYDGVDGRPFDFTDNTVHAAQTSEGVSPGDFDITGGVLIDSAADRPRNDVLKNTLAYHNGTGLWTEESSTPIVFDGFVLAANDSGFETRGAGNKSTFRNGAIIADVPGASSGTRNPQPFVVQYGSDTVLSNVRFSGWKQLDLEAHDASATRSNIILEKIGWIGAAGKVEFGEQTRVTALDGSAGIKPGLYLPWRTTWLQTKDCTVLAKGENGQAWCPKSYGYGVLQMRPAGGTTPNDTTFVDILRSDGLKYNGDSDAGGGNTMADDQGYAVIKDAGLSYGPAVARSGGYAVRTLPAETAADRFTLPVAVPVTAAPATVTRDKGIVDGVDSSETGSSALTAVSSKAAVTAGTYYYDAAAEVVWIVADDRWVTVG